MVDLHELPAGLPVPQDDGAARGLVGRRMPSVVLPATSRDDVVEHVFYPVFPPDQHAREVLAWLEHA